MLKEPEILAPVIESMKNREERRPLIFMDIREKNSDTARELARQDCTIKEKLLVVGDYLLSDRVAIERKEAGDFVASIIDGRLWQQVKALKGNFEKPVLMIEGTELYGRLKNPNAIRGALASLAIDWQMPMIFANDAREAAALIYWIARREQFEEQRETAIRGEKKAESSEEKQEFLISGLPGVSIVRAKELLRKFGCPQAVFQAGAEELQKAEGIGEKLAGGIRDVLEKPYRSRKQ